MFKGRENIINAVLSAVLGIWIIANVVKSINYRAADRFDWGSGVYTQPGNTVQVAECTFSYGSGWNYSINKTAVLSNGRENINYTEKGLNNAFYPDNLTICWYSYTEQKFYEGKFSLPYKHINELARTLRNTTDYKINLYFLAELLPQGKITVWLSDLGKYVAIGKYQAKAVNKTWEIFNSPYGGDNKTKTNSATQTALVMEEHPYSVEIHLPELLSLQDLTINPYNQIGWHLDKKNIQAIPIFKNIPHEIDITWGNEQKVYWVHYYFKDEEILSAFKKLQSLPGNNKTVLQVKVNDQNDQVTMDLKKGNMSIILPYAYGQPEIHDFIPQKEE